MESRPPSRTYAGYVLLLLTLAYTFNWMDRYALTILIDPIKRDLHLSDTAIGLITGFAFATIYSIAGIPIARWADRSVRRSIITGGLALWSSMTFASGLVRDAAQLCGARLAVGLGESACSPAAHSLIADYFGPRQRATALSVYQLGIVFGIALGLAVGGWANAAYGWRAAFIMTGLPGLVLAALIRGTLREPVRGRADGGLVDTSNYPLATAAVVLLRKRSFLIYALALGFCSFSDSAFEVWSPTYLMRTFRMDSAYVGSWTGGLEAVAGIIGTLASGLAADRLGAADVRWYLWVPAAAVGVMIPCVFLFLTVGSHLVFLFYFLSMLVASSYMGPMIALTQRLMPPRMRATAASIQFLILNLLGPGAGASSVGVLNDRLADRFGAHAIHYSLLICLLGAVAGIALAVIAAGRLPCDLEELEPRCATATAIEEPAAGHPSRSAAS